MASFSEEALEKKLDELNSSQQSIQTLSLWLIHHRKHCVIIVKVWHKLLRKVSESQKLTFMYLANDVIQNSKKKGPEFTKEFGLHLLKVFENIGPTVKEEKTVKGIKRLVDIWEERGIYDPITISSFRKAFESAKSSRKAKEREPSSPTDSIDRLQKAEENGKRRKGMTNGDNETDEPATKVARGRKKSETEVEVEVEGKTEVHVTLTSVNQSPSGDPPEPEELIKALQDLENSASSDAAIREKIADLPPEVSDASLLVRLGDRGSAERLYLQVKDAIDMLTAYNKRLTSELEDRKTVAKMLHDYVQAQKDLLVQAEERLEEYQDKLSKVYQVRQELKSHVQNLPDLTKLPDVTGGLAPLPSAGDLFNIH